MFEKEEASTSTINKKEKLKDLVRWGEAGSGERIDICEDDESFKCFPYMPYESCGVRMQS